MAGDALGLVETRGFVGSVEAADAIGQSRKCKTHWA
jgi:microcompartment protein CcmL/EutN